MFKRIAAVVTLAPVAVLPAAAHHGWSSYEADKPVTVNGEILSASYENPHVTVTVKGEILSAKYENPHATITVKGEDKVWTVTLAPTSRMISRGATKELVAAGKQISAYGYASRAEKDEMRAERITIDGKTVEMR